MAQQDAEVKISTHVHSKEATRASTTNPADYPKTAEQIIYMWGRREDGIEESKVAEPWLRGT